ncbi:MAG: serine/threonine-protein kinase [Planctomycetota bacterium]|nr:MAG: serine/threonine-protein kinase [Planctomycetota bacterium]
MLQDEGIPTVLSLDQIVDAFEEQVAENGALGVDVGRFVHEYCGCTPKRISSEIVTELLRVWLEYAYAVDPSVAVEHALGQVPGYQLPPESIRQLQFELQRLRSESVSQGSEQPGPAVPMPDVGTRWGDFELLAVLGQGAFATVYLARQVTMAGRLVSLKITARETAESDLLARLHHAAIVPIFSTHRMGNLYAVCMPYLGNTTLADLMTASGTSHSAGEVAGGGLSTCGSGRELLQRLVERQSRMDTVADLQGQVEEETWPGDAQSADLSDHSLQVRSPTALGLASLSQIETIVWIAAQIADGLAHAHRHHVWHCDIKPANILLSADGQPRLLDFNVSVRSGSANRATGLGPSLPAPIGGTLAYMAPEQFASLQAGPNASVSVDHRCDIYSLGVVLYQMLTGELPPAPFAHGTPPTDRPNTSQGAPVPSIEKRVRQINPHVSPALAAIVAKCLQTRPQDRYPAADALYEDLHAQLQHQPLKHIAEPSLIERGRKWKRRHPTLTSSLSIGLIALVGIAVTVAGLIVRGRALRRLELQQMVSASSDMLPRAIALVTAAEGYPELEDAASAMLIQAVRPWQTATRWDDGQLQKLVRADPSLREQVHQIARQFALSAWLVRHHPPSTGRSLSGPSSDLLQQWADRLSTDLVAAGELDRPMARDDQYEFSKGGEITSMELAQMVAQAYADRDYRRVVELADQFPLLLPHDYAAWLFLGHSQLKLGNDGGAIEAYTHCIALQPSIEIAWFYRGIAKLRQAKFAQAERDFSHALRIQPQFAAARFNLALALRGMGRLAAAQSTVQGLIDSGWRRTATLSLLGRLLAAQGQSQAAQQAFAQALAVEPQSELDWIQRGMLLMSSDPSAAAAALETALELNPDSVPALQNLAHLCAEKLDDAERALEALDRLLQIDAKNPARWSGRAVVRARGGDAQGALADLAQAAVLPVDNPLVAYQIACGYSLVGGLVDAARGAAGPNDTPTSQARPANPAGQEASSDGAADEYATTELPSIKQLRQVALQWFARSVREQPDIIDIAQQDADLDWLRRSPQWERAIETLRAAVAVGKAPDSP